ncbi:MAG: glycoside hydrolase family 13 protein [Lewinellaceae bacterium]|nr:glycoside hydrolase family 13 protein [Lewinellaceae bacterium]
MKSQQILAIFAALLLTGCFTLQAQSSIQRVEPPNWWAGMKNPSLQLLVYGENMSELYPSINYEGVSVERVIRVPNPNYLFIDLEIEAQARPGNIEISFQEDGKTILTHSYPLLAREKSGEEMRGYDNADVMYLVTPDRFVNGNPANDYVEGMREKPDRSNPGGRHGGDIQGMIDKLDYIADMGFTALWLNPVLENDMDSFSYHGYSITDFYRVDPRYGSNEEYLRLANLAREKGIIMIMDMITNHCGSNHWWMDDLPTGDWINFGGEFVPTNHKKAVIQDPYVAQPDYKGFVDGWFVKTMPDLNQRNELMSTYLIQNSIWWVEYLGLGGIRMDTYPYNDMDFMTDWTCAIMEEYPNFNIVGEEWVGNPTIVSFWQRGKENPNGYTSCLPGLMDFPLQEAMRKSLNEEDSDKAFQQLYEMLAQDFLYPEPYNLVVFPDNHDMSRWYTQVNEDFGFFKLGLAYVLTTRGIPQIYYGTEVLMANPGTDSHGIIRSDFPGGWAGDKVNAFTGQGLNEKQRQAMAFMKKLVSWRKGAEVVHTGHLMHYVPKDGVYVFFRYNDNGKVMVILNANEAPTALELGRFSQMLTGVKSGTDVLTGKVFEMKDGITLPGKEPLVLELSQD